MSGPAGAGSILDRDGAITLVAATVVAVLTAGVAPAIATIAVVRRAWQAPVVPDEAPLRILVLGHRLEGGAPSLAFEQRLARAAALARRFPDAKVVLLGGRSAPGLPSEAEVGRDRLMAGGLGLAPMPVAAEDRLRVEPVRLLAEGFRVHWYVTGRLLARVLRHQAWLARIR